MLAEAMVIEEARVMPPAPPPGTTNDPNAIGGQLPGTYPTEKAKLEAALPKFQAAADAYPSNEAGLTARYHVAKTLVTLGRFDEAIKAYDQVHRQRHRRCSRAARVSARPKRSCAPAQYDPAIATLKQIVDQKDASLPAEAVLMELARAYQPGRQDRGCAQDADADRRAARRHAVRDRSEGRTREAERLGHRAGRTPIGTSEP